MIVNPAIAKTVRFTPSEASPCAPGEMLHARPVAHDGCDPRMQDGLRLRVGPVGPSQEAEIRAGEVVTEQDPDLLRNTSSVVPRPHGRECLLCGRAHRRNDFRIYAVKPDKELFEAIAAKCWEFWSNHVMTGEPPAATNVEDVRKLFAKDTGEMVEATNEVATTIGELRTVKARIKELEDEKSALEKALIVALGERTGFLIGGEKAVTYKTQTTNRFDTTAFKESRPGHLRRIRQDQHHARSARLLTNLMEEQS